MTDTGSTDSRDTKASSSSISSQQKDAKAVSHLVKQKLELYINYEKRENKFDPGGSCRTTRKMAGVDLAYRVLEISKLEKKHKQNKKGSAGVKGDKANKTQNENKKEKAVQQKKASNGETESSSKEQDKGKKHEAANQKKVKRPIEPKLEKTSLKVTLSSEAERLANYANEVWESYPISDLAVIHRYRPTTPGVRKSAEMGDVQNYTRHVGSALHQKAYVDYYVEQGLDNGDSTRSKRLQNLTPRNDKDKTSKDQQKSTEKNNAKDDSTKTKLSQKTETGKSKEHKKEKKDTKARGSKARDGGRGGGKRESNWPINQHLLSADRNPPDNQSEFNYSDDFNEDESRPSTRADANNDTEEHEHDEEDPKRDVTTDNASYADDFDSDSQSETEEQDIEKTQGDKITGVTIYEEDLRRSASPSKQSDISDSQNVSELESDEEIKKHYKSRKNKDDRKSYQSEDAVSIQTYTSVEHAVERPLRLC